MHPAGGAVALTDAPPGADALRALDDLGSTLAGMRELLNDLKGR